MAIPRDRLIRSVAFGLFVGLFLLLHAYLKYVNHPSFEKAGERVGQPGQLFRGMTLDKQPFDLATDAKTHKVIILNFWESWCGPCKAELGSLQKLYAAHQKDGVELIGIFSNSSSPESVAELVRANQLTYAMVEDGNGSIGRLYGINAVPTTFVLTPDLKIVRSHEGIDEGLDDFIEKQLQSQGNRS